MGEVSMRVVIQRVARAAVHVRGETVATIGPGLLVYAAFTAVDGDRDLAWMAEKIAHLRIFEDAAGRMNRSVLEAGGAILAVSQFTLYADARKGRRPGFDLAAPAEIARPRFAQFAEALAAHGMPVCTGQFQETMQVESVNDGPVTILLDSPPPAPA
jgi:D-tyrosyl-tRNA(Tyr) deacylase